ncbi:hypothetical protein SEMRO_2170_G317410.1 [Seminavis robusta]|uniref:Uncharacterized protein n=1 Tax=Seminavis robusta TaxID=568900 RepID=A0A9N8HZ46_9STRA|nr:hypothetical protein SEMRO_2170_G317410.1 [Seminavis robusta]|eukprot:Sro2170_g317410.1 n/a (232) ;mRNA; r:6980-7675
MDNDDLWLKQYQTDFKISANDDDSLNTQDTTGTNSVDAIHADTPPRMNQSNHTRKPRLRPAHNKQSRRKPKKIDPSPLPLPPVLVTTTTTPVVWDTSQAISATAGKQRVSPRPTTTRISSQLTTSDTNSVNLHDANDWPILNTTTTSAKGARQQLPSSNEEKQTADSITGNTDEWPSLQPSSSNQNAIAPTLRLLRLETPRAPMTTTMQYDGLLFVVRQQPSPSWNTQLMT